jgi:hypothetical protein
MSAIIVQTLSRDQIRSVYPLIREVVPTLDLAGWVRFANRLANPRHAERGGVMVARRDGRPYPCGMFCYRREQDLRLGRVLVADYFIALDILAPDVVLGALVTALDDLGARMECDSIRSVLHNGSPEIACGLAAAGHRPEGAMLSKRLAGTMAEAG